MFVAVFGRRKKNWSLRSIEIRHGDLTAAFARGELARALETLLGHEPLAPAPRAIHPASRPRAGAAIRERRTTVIRV